MPCSLHRREFSLLVLSLSPGAEKFPVASLASFQLASTNCGLREGLTLEPPRCGSTAEGTWTRAPCVAKELGLPRHP
jgi:hypothetical protein